MPHRKIASATDINVTTPVSLVTRPEDEQERAGVQLGCWLAAAIGITLLGLFLLGIVGLSFVMLWHARIAAAPQRAPWFMLTAMELFE